MTTLNNFASMGKEELRAACRVAGVSYSKLNNDGMRAALAEKAITSSPENDETEGGEPVVVGNPFGGLMGSVVVPTFTGKVTRIVEGAEIDAATAPRKSVPRVHVEKTPAPFVPRVKCKGYKIQKEREVKNGVKRPSEGTVCGAVWSMLDANPLITAAELPAVADSNGWNRTNVSCEFYNWRKFNGITVRSAA